MKQSTIMKKAWLIAKLAAKKFGGTSRQYMNGKGGAMSLAWKFHKETVEELAGLLGPKKELRRTLKLVQQWYRNTASAFTGAVSKICASLFKRRAIHKGDFDLLVHQMVLSR